MPRSFDNGSWTSVQANNQAEHFKPIVRQEILTFLESRKLYGATDQEIEIGLSRPGNTIRPGRVKLVKDGDVIDSQAWRFTASHRPAKVWILAKFIETR